LGKLQTIDIFSAHRLHYRKTLALVLIFLQPNCTIVDVYKRLGVDWTV